MHRWREAGRDATVVSSGRLSTHLQQLQHVCLFGLQIQKEAGNLAAQLGGPVLSAGLELEVLAACTQHE